MPVEELKEKESFSKSSLRMSTRDKLKFPPTPGSGSEAKVKRLPISIGGGSFSGTVRVSELGTLMVGASSFEFRRKTVIFDLSVRGSGNPPS